MVKRAPVPLKPEEDTWPHAEWGLQARYTWNDGYSMCRCAAANRGSTKRQMVADLLLFWNASRAHKECKQYVYLTDDGRQYEEEFTESLAQKNTELLQLV
jgi:hypothetical protein